MSNSAVTAGATIARVSAVVQIMNSPSAYVLKAYCVRNGNWSAKAVGYYIVRKFRTGQLTIMTGTEVKADEGIELASEEFKSKKKALIVLAEMQAEEQYLARVGELGCAVCRRMGYPGTPVEIHIRADCVGMGMRSSHFHLLGDVLGLCPEHHRGATGLHGLGKRGFKRNWGYDEDDLLADTQRLLDEQDVARHQHQGKIPGK